MSVTLEGFHAVKHALRFGAEVDPVVVLDAAKAVAFARSHAPDLVGVFEQRARVVDAAEFVRVVGRAHPTGVGGVARRPAEPGFGARTAPLVLLDNPRNLGNFGAVIRVAAGLGAGGVVSVGDVDPWHPNVVRGSAGLHFAVPVGRLDGVGGIEGEVIAFDADGEDLRDARIPDGAVLAFGSERHGLSDVVRARADRVVSLPMRPKVSSYNLTTSVAMALYHWELFRRAT
ncbi:TrmH family RNA methyltransferase [Saccharothrix tamanrassetensis]|uniref:TrmH family RNA methyltransferase n=1 Tax=Saccharothrix tamanrassetensis TaxID=1051531 RepID=A0A841CEB2_9PSEU|nr:RNA methyltransferase [Saccharothrix tamanrassetensis]MBB5954487.1 TrmH family RNA methyltransferase [Saccharothrix tamanrassetensis]